MESKKRSDKKCALCKNKWKGDGPMFRVPTYKHTRKEWENACKLTFSKCAVVCTAHFKEEDYMPNWRKVKRLTRYAVPSRLLPVTDGHKFIAVGTNTFERKFVKSIYKGEIFRAERSSNIPLAPPEKSASSRKICLPMLRSTGINTDRITKVTTDVQTDVTYLDKRTCGFICLKRTGIVLNLFLCCLVCTEQYELHDYVNFGIHIGTAHTFEECFESDLNMKENWPLAKDAKAILQPRSEESSKPSIEQNEYEEIEELFIEPVDIENENVSPKENTDNSTQNPDIETKSVEETTPPIEYDELPFTDNETDSDSESEPNPLKFDHCYAQPLINKIKTYRSSILKELVEMLVNFPPLWYLRKVSESAYDSSIKTLCKLLNCRWAINLSEENLIRTVEGIKTWYRSLIMYTHVKTVTEAVICGDEYLKYYVYCAQYLPPTEEGHPPPVECPECHENVDDYANVFTHFFEKHGIYRSTPYTCELCRRQFRSIEAADAHFKVTPNHLVFPRPLVVKYTNIMRRPMICQNCDQHFYHQEVYDFHLHQHKNPSKPFVCEVCDERFAIESSYALHRNREHNMSCFVCEICNKEYEKGTPYNIHMKKHRGEYDFLCHVCGIMFLKKPNLWQHLECSHGTRANCNICNISFVGLTALQKHQRTFHLVLEGTNEDLEIQRIEKRCFWKRKVRIVRKLNSHAVCKYSGTPGPPRKYERVNEDKEAKTYSLKCPMCDKIYRQHTQLYSHLQKIHNHDPRKTNKYIEQPMVPKISKSHRKPYLNKRSTCNYTYPEQKHTINYLKIPIALPSESVSVKKPAIDTEAETAEENELLDGVVVIDDQILVQPNIRNQCRSDEEPMETMEEIVDDTRLPQISAQQTDDNGISELRDSLMNDDEAMEAANKIVPAMKASDNSTNKTSKLSRLNVDLLATPMNVLSMPLLQSPEREPEGISRLASMRADTLFSHDIDEAEFQVLMHIDDLDDT